MLIDRSIFEFSASHELLSFDDGVHDTFTNTSLAAMSYDSHPNDLLLFYRCGYSGLKGLIADAPNTRNGLTSEVNSAVS